MGILTDEGYWGIDVVGVEIVDDVRYSNRFENTFLTIVPKVAVSAVKLTIYGIAPLITYTVT